MICNTSCNSRSSMMPLDKTITLDTLSKTPMQAGQIIVGLIKMHLTFKPFFLFRESHSLSRKAAILMSQIQILPFDVDCLNSIQGDIAEHCPFENPHHSPSFVPLFYHLTISQGRPSHHFWPSWSASLSRSGVEFNHMMTGKKSGTIGIQTITNPKRHGLLAKPSVLRSEPPKVQQGKTQLLQCKKKSSSDTPWPRQSRSRLLPPEIRSATKIVFFNKTP
jgi:hypothetical protein